uniref:Uncharacterized protein n=2 Tax=Oryza TaxID=4527 RepID=Q33BJ4_ORYSJ|nr:hypothetical protein LOC_Os10g01340 [Oryza sativa Japonica Group]
MGPTSLSLFLFLFPSLSGFSPHIFQTVDTEGNGRDGGSHEAEARSERWRGGRRRRGRSSGAADGVGARRGGAADGVGEVGAVAWRTASTRSERWRGGRRRRSEGRRGGRCRRGRRARRTASAVGRGGAVDGVGVVGRGGVVDGVDVVGVEARWRGNGQRSLLVPAAVLLPLSFLP